MANSWFQFKHFKIQQNNTAMKVGTDGVLLGAWADASNAESILDIGTGTGLIALMMAQRFEAARIHAIDIDPNAAQQAKFNFEQSQWSNRLSVNAISLQEFEKQSTQKFDYIVSNPPYFINAQTAPDPKRTLARHTVDLSLHDLFNGAKSVLSDKGKFSLVFPSDSKAELVGIAAKYGFYCTRELLVKPKPLKGVIRVLLEFDKIKVTVKTETLVIENDERHDYTNDYRALTKEFYLKF